MGEVSNSGPTRGDAVGGGPTLAAGQTLAATSVIGATAMQFPLLMASIGVEAVAQFAADGTLPEPTEGKDFYDTGVALITDAPVEGLESQDSAWGLENCWG